MKVYLLKTDRRRKLFVSGGLDASDRGQGGVGGRGWVESKTRSAQAAALRAGRRAGPWLKRVRAWLSRFISPEEALLRGAFHSRRLELVHPTSLSERMVRRAWSRFLIGRARHHAIGFAINLLILPLAALAMVLPGPNVLGFWFAYRTYGHALAFLGARRLRRGEPPPVLVPDARLGHPLDEARTRAITDASSRHNGPRFNRVLGQILDGPSA